MEGFNELFGKIGDFFVNNWFNIVGAGALFIIGGILITLLSKLLMKIIYSTKIDNASGGFFVALIKVILWFFLIFACASILGIEGNSFLVAFSSVALAIGLALKDSLANIANGILIVINKPFKKGDYIVVSSVEGVVRKISILNTELTTADNKRVIVPNSTIYNNNLINYSANPTRRLDMVFSVSYDSDIKKVKQVLYEAISNYEYTLSTPAPFIYLDTQSASSLDFKVRFWVENSEYWNAYFGLNELVFEALKANDIEIPYNKLDVNLFKAMEGNKKENNDEDN